MFESWLAGILNEYIFEIISLKKFIEGNLNS
jgi:hypothetical protein